MKLNFFNQNKTKIIINTQPRSGTRFLRNELLKNLKIKDTEILATSGIELFKKPYNEYKQINILRDPKDSIVSWCAQTRFFNKTDDKEIFSDKDIKNYKDIRLNRSNVLHCINLFENFYEYLIKNQNNLFFIDFNQLIETPNVIVDKISKEYNLEFKTQKLNNSILFDSFSTSFLKTSKNIQQYQIVKKDIEKYEEKVEKLYQTYIDLKTKVLIKE
jgi:hypothetical protein